MIQINYSILNCSNDNQVLITIVISWQNIKESATYLYSSFLFTCFYILFEWFYSIHFIISYIISHFAQAIFFILLFLFILFCYFIIIFCCSFDINMSKLRYYIMLLLDPAKITFDSISFSKYPLHNYDHCSSIL